MPTFGRAILSNNTQLQVTHIIYRPVLTDMQIVLQQEIEMWEDPNGLRNDAAERYKVRNGKNNVTLKMVQPKFSPGLGEIDGKISSTWESRFNS